MNKIVFLLLYLFFHSVCFAQTESALPLMKIDPNIQAQYETCTCTNNSYTHHLVKPYLPEIETWLFQTQEDITDSSRQFICPNCEEEKETNTGFIKSITDTVNRWYKNAQDMIDHLFNDEEPVPEKKIIHPLCFQMGRKFVDEQGSNKQFFSCIHDHYDGSEKGLCRAVSDQPFSPKQCMAIPISCQDVNNENLSCLEELKYRLDYFKQPDGCNKGASYPRRPCFSQLYTAMTMKAFYDISQCLEIDEHLAFSLFFHESRFVLNIKSHTGALCYGQVTGDAVTDFNLLLKGRLYPDLKPFVEPSRCPKAWGHFQKIKTTRSVTRHILRSAQDQCRLNLNPYTCFFYGMGYLKILTYYAEKAVSKANKIGRIWQNNKWLILWDLPPEKTTETQPNGVAPNGIEPNEVETNGVEPNGAEPNEAETNEAEPDEAEPNAVESNEAEPDEATPNAVESNGAEPDEAEPNAVESNEAEPDATQSNGTESNETYLSEKQSNEIEEIKIFKNVQDLIRILVILSYNGGPSINNYFKQYMKVLKKNLEADSALQQVLFESGLNLDSFRDGFTKFLKQNYQPANRRIEVSQFLDKVIKDTLELNRLIAIQHPELQQNICPSIL